MTEFFDVDDHDRFAELDGAYVLGALEPAERLAFERHLSTCRRCAEAVTELAGLPGMLSRVPLEHVLSESPAPPVALLPSLARRARRDRRRRQVVTVLAAAAAVLVAAVLGGVVWGALRPSSSVGTGQPPTAGVAAQQQMAVLVSAPVSATAAVQTTPFGTKVSMRCDHGGAKPRAGEWYTLWVIPQTGPSEQIASWAPAEYKIATIEGDTWLPKSKIAAIEVHAADGTPVLRLSV